MTDQNDSKLNICGADIAVKTEKLLQKLMHVMGQENLALQAHNRALAEEMAQEKTLLIGNYRALIKELQQDPDAYKKLDESIRNHIAKMVTDFEDAMKENARVVYGRRYAVKRLLDRILNKARDAAASPVKSYNANGKMHAKCSSGGSVPIQLNETY